MAAGKGESHEVDKGNQMVLTTGRVVLLEDPINCFVFDRSLFSISTRWIACFPPNSASPPTRSRSSTRFIMSVPHPY
ncbi:hypothetical protein OPV22_010083 [Ensete ventricosum]|uniref:Uncharacterized protein n=1 Tax=Ensete ventricosum TaxID=4639 RepID=A0AAV8RAD1_ENSVE|nr:hypothetical protein OPV22_010083 [Ensete ventricosum]